MSEPVRSLWYYLYVKRAPVKYAYIFYEHDLSTDSVSFLLKNRQSTLDLDVLAANHNWVRHRIKLTVLHRIERVIQRLEGIVHKIIHSRIQWGIHPVIPKVVTMNHF